MKSTTGAKSEAFVSGKIPLKHDRLPEADDATYGAWLDVQLAALEERYADFGTRVSFFESVIKGRS